MDTIRVLLVDDHALIRAGIRSVLEKFSGIVVVDEASDGREALELIRQHQPRVVLMDIGMPGMNGLEALARATKESPAARVIMLSAHDDETYVVQALRAGAAGYLLKEALVTELELAVRAVAQGETYLSPPVAKHMIADYRRRLSGQPERMPTSGGPFHQLTPRQREVLQLIAEGHTTPDIARVLDLSVKTVETHRMNLMERLDIHEVAGLVRYAVRTGLVSTDDPALQRNRPII